MYGGLGMLVLSVALLMGRGGGGRPLGPDLSGETLAVATRIQGPGGS